MAVIIRRLVLELAAAPVADGATIRPEYLDDAHPRISKRGIGIQKFLSRMGKSVAAFGETIVDKTAATGKAVGRSIAAGARTAKLGALQTAVNLEEAVQEAPILLSGFIGGFFLPALGAAKTALVNVDHHLLHPVLEGTEQANKSLEYGGKLSTFLHDLVSHGEGIWKMVGGGVEWLHGWLEKIEHFVKSNPALRFLGPILAINSLRTHLREWRQGPHALAEDARTRRGREHLEREDSQGKRIHAQFWNPLLFTDLLSVSSGIMGILAPGVGTPVSLLSGIAGDAWGGIFKKKWGLGLPLLELIHRKQLRGTGAVSSIDDGAVAREIGRSRGTALPGQVRAKLEPSLGSFGNVRVHTDAPAAAASRAVGAEAFTLGNDVFFNKGAYDPGSARGLALLGHELTHVRQGARGIARKASAGLGGSDRYEAEAERNEQRILAGLTRRKALPSLGATPRLGGAPVQKSERSGSTASPGSGPVPETPSRAGRVRIRRLTVRFAGLAAQRKTLGFGGELVQPKLLARGKGASSANLGAIRESAGMPLPSTVRQALEPAFGTSFADVRIHADGAAASAAQSIHAEAFTLGRDIYFNSGFYSPGSPRGVALIGHELTHVAQNRGAAKTLRPAALRRKAMDDAIGFWEALDGAVRHYGGAIDYKDEQKVGVFERFVNTGHAQFVSGDDAVESTQLLRKWILFQLCREGQSAGWQDEQTHKPQYDWNDIQQFDRVRNPLFDDSPDERKAGARGRGSITQEELIYKALQATHGNVTQAMGSLAEIFCEGYNRKFAKQVKGLRGTDKDYYRFAGAYAGMQQNVGTRFLGGLGGAGNILGNVVVGTAVGVAGVYKNLFTGNTPGMLNAYDAWMGRLSLRNNANKAYEFSLGLATGGGFRYRTDPSDPEFQKTLKKIDGYIDEYVQPKSFVEVAGHDGYEDQALANERAILAAFKGGTPLTGMPATPGGTGGARLAVRRKSWFSEFLESNREYWDDVGVRGIQRGGVLGYTQAGLAALASAVNNPSYVARQSKAYVVGFGTGAWDGIKGMVNMVRHPIQTGEGIYNLVVHWDKTKAGLSAKVRQMLDHATSDPELFAKECGEIAGQIDIALVGPKAIGGVKEVTGFLKTLKNISPLPGRTLWYYSDAAGAAGIEATSTIGRTGAAFATALDPLLGGAKSVAGMVARNVFLGGRLDFVFKAGKLVSRIKPAFTHATSFTGGAFRPILLTNVEWGFARFCKTISGYQFAASTPQQVTVLAQQILANPSAAQAFFEAANMMQQGAVIVDGVRVSLEEIAGTDWSKVQPDPKKRDQLDTLARKRRGTSRLDDDDPALGVAYRDVLHRRGRDPGVSLDLSSKYRLERILGREVGEVRLHSGPVATELAAATEAQAVTVGRDIYAPSGSLDTGTVEGLGLLVHEATHVAQTARSASPTASPRSLGGGAGIEAMETVAHSIEARFVAGARSRPYAAAGAPVPAFREAPAPAMAAVAAVAGPATPPPVSLPPAAMATPGPAAARVAPVARKEQGASQQDPVQRVMTQHHVQGVSQDEFLEVCAEKLLELMKDELAGEAERRETQLAWNHDVPLA